jgi:Uma2 family endonuclease
MNVQTQSLCEMIETLPENSTLVLHEVSWAEYEEMLALLPDTARFRLSYDQGTLQIMTLSPRHERLTSLFTPLLTVLAEEQNLNLVSLGSTTFKRAGADRGLEPDDCYYIHQAERIAGRDTIDLDVDPPPELVIEVDITHPSQDKLPIYGSLGVMEVWRHDGHTLHFLRLHEEQYTETAESLLFPGLPATTLADFVRQGNESGIIPMVRAFRTWVRANRQP